MGGTMARGQVNNHQTRVLILSHDVVGDNMAGPGIRYYHLARVLDTYFDVTLAVPSISRDDFSPDFSLVRYQDENNENLVKAIKDADILLAPAIRIHKIFPLLPQTLALIVDGYDPFVAETLSLQMESTELQQVLTQAYLAGDFFICASERQRDWWLGLLEANGRVNPYTFGEDRSLRQLVDVVPYGLPSELPKSSMPVIKGVWPGIALEDKVLLWGGGLWPWLDPLTAIRAVARIWEQRQDVRLVFPGTKHPNPLLDGIPTHNEVALNLARELGILDRAVFFGDWVPYKDWPQVLLESDVALTLHGDTLETRLAFRSRVLEYIWAGLPTVATKGDATSDLIAEYDIGVVVDYENVEDVAEAILHLLEKPRGFFDEGFRNAREQLTWEKAVQPLIRFCRQPRRAPDKVAWGEELGNPFYVEKRRHLVEERNQCREIIQKYEQGRFIQFMRYVDQWKAKFGSILHG